MALDVSKEDVGKGGASPAPLPKILESYRDKPRSGLRWGSLAERQQSGEGAEIVLHAKESSPEKSDT